VGAENKFEWRGQSLQSYGQYKIVEQGWSKKAVGEMVRVGTAFIP
jgi:hypothetical protein